MKLVNNVEGYGLVSILLHWIMAIVIIALFILGHYMVGLTYYDPWYLKAPDLHRSVGVIVAALLVLRLTWRLSNYRPKLMGRQWEQKTALMVHRLFYILLTAIIVSGYLITTADGQGVSVFGYFSIPAIITGLINQEDTAGLLHEWLANILIALVIFHGMAALKHQIIDRDSTLQRILKPR